MQQPSQPFMVTIIEEPARQTTVGDVIIGAFGVTGVLAVLSVLLGGLLAMGLVWRHRRHPPELEHLPPVSPLVADPNAPSSSQAQ